MNDGAPHPTEAQEARIIECFAANDPAALELIYDLLAPRARRWLRTKLRNTLAVEDRDDVISNALCKAWAGRQQFDRSRRLAPWFHAIVRNAAFDFLRVRTREQPRDLEFARHAIEEGKLPPHGEVRSSGYPASVAELLQSLSTSNRELLNEYLTSGHRHNWTADLAKRRNVSQASLRVKKHRIVQQLRNAFGTREEDLKDD